MSSFLLQMNTSFLIWRPSRTSHLRRRTLYIRVINGVLSFWTLSQHTLMLVWASDKIMKILCVRCISTSYHTLILLYFSLYNLNSEARIMIAIRCHGEVIILIVIPAINTMIVHINKTHNGNIYEWYQSIQVLWWTLMTSIVWLLNFILCVCFK